MHTLEEIMEAARRLSDRERKRLVAALEATKPDHPSEQQQRSAMRSWLSVAGRYHSDTIL